MKCYGIVIVKLNDGTEQLIPFEDRLYFEHISDKNTGAVGLVFYEFVPLASGCSVQLSPYQEVASGYDNEKFNGDYGASIGGFAATPPSLTFVKTGPTAVAGGGTASYSLAATNTGTTGLGDLSLSLPFVFEDAVPPGLVYVAGSATSSNTIPPGNSVTASWSTDNGATWESVEPVAADVTDIRWTLSAPLAPALTPTTVGFQATVPVLYASATIDNTGVAKLGTSGSLASDTVTTLVSGINSLGDFVWRDLDRDGIQDGGTETGIANITVRLYYDADADGSLDPADPLFGTTTTNASGIYAFTNLLDGKFIVEVDDADADMPAGYSLPNSASTHIAVDLDSPRSNSSPVAVLTADWGFIGALEVVKSVSPSTYGAGELINFTIDLENHAAAVPAASNTVQTAYVTTVSSQRTAQNPTNSQGAPNNVFSRVDYAQNSDYLQSSGGVTFATPTGTITKVELVFDAYLTQALSDDRLEVTVGGTTTTLNATQLNTLLGSTQTYAVDVTSLNGSWTWTLAQALTGRLQSAKAGSNDGATLWVDSFGICFHLTPFEVFVAVLSPYAIVAPCTSKSIPSAKIHATFCAPPSGNTAKSSTSPSVASPASPSISSKFSRLPFVAKPSPSIPRRRSTPPTLESSVPAPPCSPWPTTSNSPASSATPMTRPPVACLP